MTIKAKKSNSQRFVPFRSNDRWYAVAIEAVEGVVATPEVIVIPGNASRVLVGLAYASGQLLTVLDIAPLDNHTRNHQAPQLLIIKVATDYYAVLADEVAPIIAPSQAPATVRHPLLAAQVHDAQRTIGIIDCQRLVTQHAICK
mgnify:CR=1 FL=1